MTKLNVDAELTNTLSGVIIIFFTAVVVGIIGLFIWYFVPTFYSKRKHNQALKLETANAVWFDLVESVLHCGNRSKRIEPYSLQYYVIQFTFSAPTGYTTDTDVMDEKEHRGDENRSVYHAVRLVNDKAKQLGLKEDLLKRGKQSTSVNDEYRQRILKN